MNGLKKLIFGKTEKKVDSSPAASIEQSLIKDSLEPKGSLLQLKEDGDEEVIVEDGNGSLGLLRIDDGSTYLLKVSSSKITIKFPFTKEDYYYCEPGILCWTDGDTNYLFRTSPSSLHLFALFLETLEEAGRHSFGVEDFKIERKVKFILSGKEKVSFHSGPASFWLFRREEHQFHPINEDPNCRAIISKEGSSKLWLTIISSTCSLLLHRQLIDPDATLHTDRASLSFIWCCFDSSDEVKTFSLRFLTLDPLLSMANEMGNVIFELLNDGNTVPKEDKSYLFRSKFNCDVEMRDAPALDSSDECQSESESESDGEEYNSFTSKSRNEQMVVGMRNADRNYVLQDGGKRISIFGNKDSNSSELNLLNQISLPDSMKMLMLHKEDNEMFFRKDDSTVCKMNLERGKIVEEWDMKCTSLLPSQKYSQLTDEATMIGFDKNSIFGIDTRISGRNKKIPLSGKEYASNVKFSSAATTGTGNIAVGNEKGEIRLFSGLGDKRAKTLIPGFGDPIKGVDTSYDGRWIIVTCKTYLLLIDTKEEGSNNSSANGFLKGMKDKPIPRRLQLLPEHQSYIGGKVDFSVAKFSMFSPQENHEERSIVTSTGNYVITWNMRRVKAGRLFDYQIRRYDEGIVADSFKFGKDREIVVALPNEITLLGGGMKSPTPSLFGKGNNKR